MEWTANEIFLIIVSLKSNLCRRKNELSYESNRLNKTKEDMELEILELELLLEKFSALNFETKKLTTPASK